MNRAILVILTLVLFGSVAVAGPKQKIAILGLEAVSGADGLNPADTAFAKELTKELRSRANNSKDYELTKDQGELADEKLMNNCGSENPQCMAPIGSRMKADVMLFGRVSNLGAGKGYKVSLTLVSVSKQKQIQTDQNAQIAANETRNPGLGNWVREHWRKVTGETSDGTIIVTVPGGVSGRVLVDGEVKETLKSGTATIVVPEGNRYRITVEADGYKTWEKENVSVAGEKSVELKPELTKVEVKVIKDPNEGVVKDPNEGVIKREGTISKPGHSKTRTIFKVAAIVGLGGAAVAGAGWIYSWRQTDFSLPAGTMVTGASSANSISQDDCGKSVTFTRNGSTDGGAADDFASACKGYKRTKWLIPTTVGLGVVGGAALVYVLMSKDDSESAPTGTTSGRQKKRRNLIVTPVVSPDGTGATLRFDW